MDKNHFFTFRKNLEGRFEPAYHIPEIASLDNEIRARSKKKLRDYIINIASGATPSVTNSELYSDSENGVPFIRVQNLKTTGQLDLSHVKYISKHTHCNLLNRSQINEYDLLVKITGVGRMAIASVAPKGFEGNCNQHLVVIKTNSKETSDYLARYLNLNIIEKLATRRSTGGTRPALDYPALKSIPVVEGVDFSKIDLAIDIKKQKKQQAKRLLASIGVFLLNELGIQAPILDNSLCKRIFTVNFSQITGDRLDAFAVLNKEYRISGGTYENFKLREIAKIKKGQSITSNNIKEGNYPVIAGGQSSPYYHNKSNFEGNVITVSASGAYSGYIWYHTKPIFASDCSVIYSKDEDVISTQFLSEILKLKQQEIYNLQQGSGQPHVYPSDLIKLDIPVPPKEKQMELLKKIKKIRHDAKELKDQESDIIDQAQKEVEQMILGK